MSPHAPLDALFILPYVPLHASYIPPTCSSMCSSTFPLHSLLLQSDWLSSLSQPIIFYKYTNSFLKIQFFPTTLLKSIHAPPPPPINELADSKRACSKYKWGFQTCLAIHPWQPIAGEEMKYIYWKWCFHKLLWKNLQMGCLMQIEKATFASICKQESSMLW